MDVTFHLHKPFTALFCDSEFYVIYREGGQRPDKLYLREVTMGDNQITKGSLLYFGYGLSDKELMLFDGLDDDRNWIYTMFLLYVTVDDDNNDMETTEHGNSISTIIDYKNHMVYNGIKSVLPVIWDTNLVGQIANQEHPLVIDNTVTTTETNNTGTEVGFI